MESIDRDKIAKERKRRGGTQVPSSELVGSFNAYGNQQRAFETALLLFTAVTAMPVAARRGPKAPSYENEGRQWLPWEELPPEHVISGHADCKLPDCRGCVMAKDVQGYRYKNSSSKADDYYYYERPVAGDLCGKWERGFCGSVYHMPVICLDTGEGFVGGLRGKDEDSFNCGIDAMCREFRLDEPAQVWVWIFDHEKTLAKSLKVNSVLALRGGRVKSGIPGQHVAVAERWVRRYEELVSAELISTALDPRHAHRIGTVLMVKRNRWLGFEARTNKVAHMLKLGCLSTAVLPPSVRARLQLPKHFSRSVVCTPVGVLLNSTAGVIIEFVATKTEIQTTIVNFGSVRQSDVFAYGWQRQGLRMIRKPNSGSALPDSSSSSSSASTSESDSDSDSNSDAESSSGSDSDENVFHFFPRGAKCEGVLADAGVDVDVLHEDEHGTRGQRGSGVAHDGSAEVTVVDLLIGGGDDNSELSDAGHELVSSESSSADVLDLLDLSSAEISPQLDPSSKSHKMSEVREGPGSDPGPAIAGPGEVPGLQHEGPGEAPGLPSNGPGDGPPGQREMVMFTTDTPSQLFDLVGAVESAVNELPVRSVFECGVDECAPIFVTRSVTTAELRGPIGQTYNWDVPYAKEVTRVVKDFGALHPPVAFSEIDPACSPSFGELLGVNAVKYFDLDLSLHEPKMRLVFGGHRIWDYFGNYIRNVPLPEGIERIAHTCPTEVRTAITWALLLIGPEEAEKVAIYSFDVTGAYLHGAWPADSFCYATASGKLLDTILKVSGWNWDSSTQGKPWFRLACGLYGHPCSGDLWSSGEFESMMLALGYEHLMSDQDAKKSVYVRRENGRIVVLLLIYVDDGLLFSLGDRYREVKELLEQQWEAREWHCWYGDGSSEPARFLAADYRIIASDQDFHHRLITSMVTYKQMAVKKYIESEGELSGAAPRTPVACPEFGVEVDGSEDESQDPEPSVTNLSPASHIGTWSYPAQNSCPELSLGVNFLARGQNKWNVVKGKALKRFVKWVKNNMTVKVDFVQGGDIVEAWIFEDSDHGGDPDTRRSTSSWLIVLVGEHGTRMLIDWKTMLQKSVALSTAEAEVVALRDCLKRLLTLLPFLEQLFPGLRVRIFCDASACIEIAKTGKSKALAYARKSHDLSVRWLAEQLRMHGFLPTKINGKVNHADLLNKPLPLADTTYHLECLGVVPEEQALKPRCTGSCFCPHMVQYRRCLRLVDSSDASNGDALCEQCQSERGCDCHGNRNWQASDGSLGSVHMVREDAQEFWLDFHERAEVDSARRRRRGGTHKPSAELIGSYNPYGNGQPDPWTEAKEREEEQKRKWRETLEELRREEDRAMQDSQDKHRQKIKAYRRERQARQALIRKKWGDGHGYLGEDAEPPRAPAVAAIESEAGSDDEPPPPPQPPKRKRVILVESSAESGSEVGPEVASEAAAPVETDEESDGMAAAVPHEFGPMPRGFVSINESRGAPSFEHHYLPAGDDRAVQGGGWYVLSEVRIAQLQKKRGERPKRNGSKKQRKKGRASWTRVRVIGGAPNGTKPNRRSKRKKPRRGPGRKPNKHTRKRRGGTHKPSAELIGSYNPYGNGQPAKKKRAAPEDEEMPASVAPAVGIAGAASAGPAVPAGPSAGTGTSGGGAMGAGPASAGPALAGEADPIEQLTQQLDALDIRSEEQRRDDFEHRHDTQCRKIINADGVPRRCRRTRTTDANGVPQLYCWQHDPSYVPKPKAKKKPGPRGPSASSGPACEE
jgi:hypothetical protein